MEETTGRNREGKNKRENAKNEMVKKKRLRFLKKNEKIKEMTVRKWEGKNTKENVHNEKMKREKKRQYLEKSSVGRTRTWRKRQEEEGQDKKGDCKNIRNDSQEKTRGKNKRENANNEKMKRKEFEIVIKKT